MASNVLTLVFSRWSNEKMTTYNMVKILHKSKFKARKNGKIFKVVKKPFDFWGLAMGSKLAWLSRKTAILQKCSLYYT